MTDEEKLLRMFAEVHGNDFNRCTVEVDYDEDDNLLGVSVTKCGALCWKATKTDILFDYITRGWE